MAARLELERVGDDPFGRLIEQEDQPRGREGEGAMVALTGICPGRGGAPGLGSRSTIHHFLAAGAERAVLRHLGRRRQHRPHFSRSVRDMATESDSPL
jgi:hypothetical protein